MLPRHIAKVFAVATICLLGLAALPRARADQAYEDPRPKVLLVTSIDGFRVAQEIPWVLGFLRGEFRDYDHGLETIFRDFFKDRGFDAQVAHYADQNDLATYLHSPDYSGIYIVSHEGSADSANPGVNTGGIFDYDGYEITPVIEQIHPHLKTLALVGCLSSSLTQKLDARFRAAGTNPALELWGFGKKVDGKKGLRSALTASLPHLLAPARQPVENCAPKRGFPLFFKRTCETAAPAVRVESGGEVIAVLPHCQAGETLEKIGYASASQLKFTVTAGINAFTTETPAIGTIEISRPEQDPSEGWRLFTKPDGTPFGTTSHVYRHFGALPEPMRAQTYSPFHGCRFRDGAPDIF